MKDFSYITNSHPEFIENLYRDFSRDPESVDPEMKKFFEGFDFAITTAAANGKSATAAGTVADAGKQLAENVDWMREIRVYRMILGYRNKGHLLARTNPIRTRKNRGPILNYHFMVLLKQTWMQPFMPET